MRRTVFPLKIRYRMQSTTIALILTLPWFFQQKSAVNISEHLVVQIKSTPASNFPIGALLFRYEPLSIDMN